MLDAQPAAVYPASPDDPSRKSKFGFGWNITAFISWPLFCRQMSPSGWNLTRHHHRQRNLSSMTALLICPVFPKTYTMGKYLDQFQNNVRTVKLYEVKNLTSFRHGMWATAHYSEGSLFRRSVIPKVRYSEGLLFRRFDSPKIKLGLIIRKWNKVH